MPLEHMVLANMQCFTDISPYHHQYGCHLEFYCFKIQFRIPAHSGSRYAVWGEARKSLRPEVLSQNLGGQL